MVTMQTLDSSAALNLSASDSDSEAAEAVVPVQKPRRIITNRHTRCNKNRRGRYVGSKRIRKRA